MKTWASLSQRDDTAGFTPIPTQVLWTSMVAGRLARCPPHPQLRQTAGHTPVEVVTAWATTLGPALKQAIDTHYNQLGDEAQYEILLRSMGGSS